MNKYNELIRQHRLYPVYENIKGVLFDNWMEPLLNIDILDDSLCLEWWKDNRKLTIYIDDIGEFYFIKTRPGNLEDGTTNFDGLIPIYSWLVNGEEY